MNSRESPFSDARLCYVEGSWAYFTTQSLDKQWGDDWNDAPYEHNAGEPYTWRPTQMIKAHGEWTTIPNGASRWEIVKVAWEANDCETPAERDPPNSRYSVEQINARKVPWLTDPGYGTRPRVYTPVVWAGATLAEFTEIIEARGGRVYLLSVVPCPVAVKKPAFASPN